MKLLPRIFFVAVPLVSILLLVAIGTIWARSFKLASALFINIRASEKLLTSRYSGS
jgi:hypothetical protein